jgi:hypothetical protein
MNSNASFRNFLMLILISGLLLSCIPMLGHPGEHGLSTNVGSAGGYWQLFTDYDTRITSVSFYNLQGQLRYQENIHDRYFKRTKRTTHRFDKLLHRLLDTNQVESYNLMATNQWSATKEHIPVASLESRMPLTKEFSVYVKVFSEVQLMLSYLNPTSERLLITIANENSEYFHKEKSIKGFDSQLLSLGRLPPGPYRLELSGNAKKVRYDFVIDQEHKGLKLVLSPTIISR